jgi:predicted benzoate:H+ symporter BenE
MRFHETEFPKQLLAVVIGTALFVVTVASFTIQSIGISGWALIIGKVVASLAIFSLPSVLAFLMPKRINANWLQPKVT